MQTSVWGNEHNFVLQKLATPGLHAKKNDTSKLWGQSTGTGCQSVPGRSICTVRNLAACTILTHQRRQETMKKTAEEGDSCQSLDTVMFYTFIHPLQSSKFFTQIFYLTFYRDPWIPVCWQTQNYKWQNGKRYKGKPNRVQSALAQRMRQGCTGPPPPPHFVFVISRKFRVITKTKISQQPYSYTICHLLLTLPFRLLADSSMRRGNATLIWRRIRNHAFPFCHL